MPRTAIEDNSRMSFRVTPQEKALLLRAAAYQHSDLTAFVIRNAIRVAETVIEEAERLSLSERDATRVLAALESPPRPNKKLLAAAKALPKLK